MKRLQSNLESYSLWNERFNSRIVPVVGDLSNPLFGLSARQFGILASEIDVIYHNGALVNFFYPYPALKATNVSGTHEILRLAAQIKLKALHYISTVGIFIRTGDSDQVIREEDVPDGKIPNGGYAQSKWVAEKLVRTARSRGLPVTIYRPGLVTGHSRTGIWNRNDIAYGVILSSIELGILPKLGAMADIVPVDYVSRAVVYLSRERDFLGKTFHLVNPHPIGINELAAAIRSSGHPVELVSYQEWLEKLGELLRRSGGNVLSPVLPLIQQGLSEGDLAWPPFDCHDTLEALAGSSITCPRVDELLGTYISSWIRGGFLSAPLLTGEVERCAEPAAAK